MFTVSILNNKKEYERIEVPELVYLYIKQLEVCINFPEHSKLKETYKDRFNIEDNSINSLITYIDQDYPVKTLKEQGCKQLNDS